MTGKEVAAMRDDEIKIELSKLRNELFDLRSKSVTAKVENTSRFPKLRSDIARMLAEQGKRTAAKAPPKAPKRMRAPKAVNPPRPVKAAAKA